MLLGKDVAAAGGGGTIVGIPKAFLTPGTLKAAVWIHENVFGVTQYMKTEAGWKRHRETQSRRK